MQNHTKIYADFFGYQVPEDFICEITGDPATDIHHIFNRKMGGDPTKSKDVIENLMAVSRDSHEKYGDIPELRPMLQLIHLKFMKYHGIPGKVAQIQPALNEKINLLEKELKNERSIIR